MWRSLASNALSLFIVLLILAAGLLAWGRETFIGSGPLTEAVCFRVERGASLSGVSRSLEAQGAIKDARIFRIGADYTDKAQSLKAGSYLIAPQSSMVQVLELITAGGQSTCGREVNFRIGVNAADLVLREVDAASNRYVEIAKFSPAKDEVPAEYKAVADESDIRYRVTLAEGVTSWQVVEALKSADFLTGDVGTLPVEGSLAPDSYEVVKGGARAELIARMEAAQVAVLDELWAGREEGLPYASKEEALIMASIVEKETGVASERPQVASVFVNRLAKGMPLQTDPTVIYGVTKGQGVLGRGLRRSELDRPTPYNTYVIKGLPPGPIANPGRLSIEATLHPAKTDYLYFVADGTGGHAFATNLADHNSNVARWREIEKQQQAN